jgi:LysM repeat protein
MLRKLIGVILLSLVATNLMAASIALKANSPQRYIVKSDDTLWSIANVFLQGAWQWPALWDTDSPTAKPQLIYPGDTLVLSISNGQPRLKVEQKLINGGAGLRAQANMAAIPPLPTKTVAPFLTRNQIMNLPDFLAAPYILAAPNADKLIYARGLTNAKTSKYLVLQRNESFIDPRSKALLGVQAQYVASATLKIYADPSVLTIIQAKQMIHVGDRLFPDVGESQTLRFIPHAPDGKVMAQIVGALNDVTKIDRNDIVVLNYGTAQGAEPGQVLNVLRAGAKTADKNAVVGATQKIGEIMIFRCFDKVSFALVMQAKQTLYILDRVRTPIPKG